MNSSLEQFIIDIETAISSKQFVFNEDWLKVLLVTMKDHIKEYNNIKHYYENTKDELELMYKKFDTAMEISYGQIH